MFKSDGLWVWLRKGTTVEGARAYEAGLDSEGRLARPVLGVIPLGVFAQLMEAPGEHLRSLEAKLQWVSVLVPRQAPEETGEAVGVLVPVREVIVCNPYMSLEALLARLSEQKEEA